MVRGSYSSTNAGTIVNDLFERYLQVEGIAVGQIDDGADIDTYDIDSEKLSMILDDLAEKSNFTWYIDENRDLYFFAKDTEAAPWELTEADVIAESEPSCEFGNSQYRNIQYARGYPVTDSPTSPQLYYGNGTRQFWLLPAVPDSAPTITEDSVSKTVGKWGIDTGYDWYWQEDGLILFAAVPPGDSVEIEVTVSYKSPTVALKGYMGDTLIPEYPSEQITANRIIQGSEYLNNSGVVEDVVDRSNSTEADVINDLVFLFNQYATDGIILNFDTERSGLKIGQVLTVTLPVLDLDGVDLLIESVSIAIDGDIARYSVKATAGPTMLSYQKFYKNLSQIR
jgi:hypothetical protein